MSFHVNGRVSIKITVYETTHKKYYKRVARTTMSKSAKSNFTKKAGGFSHANSKYESQARSGSSTNTSSESKGTSVGVAGSAAGKGGGSVNVSRQKSSSSSNSASYSRATTEAVSQSVSATFEDAQSLSEMQESSLSHENEESLEFQDGTTQIYALIKTTITIDGKSVINLEERYLTAGLTEHISAGLVHDRLASWEHKAWRDFFHMGEVPSNSLYSYDLQWPAKTAFRATRVGRRALYNCKFMVWTPGDFLIVVCGSGIIQMHKKFGITSHFPDDFHRLDAGTYLETDKKGGMLYVAGSKKTSDSTPDERKIYRIDLVTGVSEIVNVKIPVEQEVKGMAGFNGKLYYMSMLTPEKMEVCAFDPDADKPTISKLFASDYCDLERDEYTMTACPDGVYFTTPWGRLKQLDMFGKVYEHYEEFKNVKSMCFSDGFLYGTTTEEVSRYFIPPSTEYGVSSDVSPSKVIYHPVTGNQLTWGCICGGFDGVFGMHVQDNDQVPGFYRYHRVKAFE